MDDVSLRGDWPGGGWTGTEVGAGPTAATAGRGGFQQAGGAFTVSGSGDIAPAVSGQDIVTPISQTLVSTFAGLIAVITVAVMFITAEYRRGLIHLSLAASPRRGRLLAAKAVVVGAVAFAAGLVGAAVTIPLAEHVLRRNGNFIAPISALTELRVVIGTAALLAVAAVMALAVGAMLRRSAAAVTALIVVTVLPYLFAVATPGLPAGARRLASRGHAGRRLRRPADQPAVSAGERHLLAVLRLLPAGALGRLRCTVRLGRARVCPGPLPAAPAGRVSFRDALHAEWTKTRTLAR